MLSQLSISNYAIVEHLELDFRDGMTAITGETGAGKSILLDALSLCLGERADAGSVRHGASRADLAVRFDIEGLPDARAWLAERDLDDTECLLRRSVTANGRSRAWINGVPATLADLKALSEHLIDIHGQHAHQTLMREETHLRLLDDFAGHSDKVEQLTQIYRQWQQASRRLKAARENGDEQQARCQLLRYQVEELDALALGEEELSALEEEQTRLANAEELITQAQFAADCCDDDESGALNQLNQARQRLEQLPGSDSGALANILSMLNDACIQLQEAGYELHRYVSSTELDPDRLMTVESRLAEIHRIARKHHVMPEEVPALHQRLQAELSELQDGGEDMETLVEATETARNAWRELAHRISEQRMEAARRMGEEVQSQLAFLGMEKADFTVDITRRDTAQPEGMDRVGFLISANPGQPARALTRVASGGELSRVSLAIQVVAAQHSTIPTLVFDEVDVGISGATAEIVGQLLRQLGSHGQILCVTHLPQVAAQGHQHLHIEKQADEQTTHTTMALLDEGGRVRELARMLGGVHLSERTLAHAREMLDVSQRSAH
ncbi:DNA repair protein RecN [Kushneria indalinina]|uniref:DNA repair protein RecN n=1 Tax=Kushneria indalinina DSM 14324 TaxID=1122140 RepID=A0A3D9DRP6_9GAMM|nr:DNA repair protein RecN [Kushneria indalinina]REC93433.1 DNA replication and repair protein RecN [Kushneria indalinina DSM 14324]